LKILDEDTYIKYYYSLPDNFQDFPDWSEEKEKFNGEGIKKDRAFKTTLHFDELASKREEFWEYLGRNTYTKAIKLACRSDHSKK
jgi:hypothetical protein